MYRNSQQFNCRSAGTAASARVKVTLTLVQWADVIFVMEHKHKKQLTDQFQLARDEKEIIVLNVPDEYEYLNPDLIELIQGGVEDYFSNIH